ncbi:MAG: hypothetical protein HYW88_00995, partial [Candidatus Sungbacteria bacterium]|nr:hypothetical protein [Candidatus Sungbacteria bacterium]
SRFCRGYFSTVSTYLRDILNDGTRIVILEDSYSTKLSPENGTDLAASFSQWSDEDKKNIMFVYCWVANRVLSQRDTVPTPSGFRSLEEWETLFQKLGFVIEHESFLGFPAKRDINTPQSLLVTRIQK